jgi:hypothetical protein
VRWGWSVLIGRGCDHDRRRDPGTDGAATLDGLLARTVIAVVLGMLLMPAGAVAQDPGFGNPALDQYVEGVPTTGGTQPSTTKGNGGATPLGLEARRSVRKEGGRDSAALEALATTPATTPDEDGGTGSSDPAAPGGDDGGPAAPAAADQPALREPEAGALTAAGGAVGLGESSTLALLAGLSGTAAVAAGLVVSRRRRGAERDPS